MRKEKREEEGNRERESEGGKSRRRIQWGEGESQDVGSWKIIR